MRFGRFLAAGAVIALAGCAAHTAGTDRAGTIQSALRPALVDSLQMVSATDGWALVWIGNPDIDAPAGLEPAVTTDGGRSWLPVPPAGTASLLADDTLVTLSPAGAQRAWLFVGGTSARGTPRSGQTEVFSTENGGRTWQRLSTLPVGQVTGDDFVDREHGWLLESLGAAMEQNPVRLYRTTDGGSRWSLVAQTAPTVLAAPSSSGLPVSCDKVGPSFATSQIGFVTGYCNEQAVWVSRDAGQHWSEQRLPLPASTCLADGCSIPPPQFVGRVGYLTIGDPPATSLLLVSDNDGASWHQVMLPAEAGQARVTFFTATDGIAIPTLGALGSIGRVFYVTADGGKSWTAVPQGRSFGTANVSFDFVSATTGFAMTNAANAQAGTTPPMFQTANSGRTWVSFTPKLR